MSHAQHLKPLKEKLICKYNTCNDSAIWLIINSTKELQGYGNRMNFLDFPKEIQRMILTVLLAENKTIALARDRWFAWKKSLAVFRSCQAVGNMARDIFYDLNTFDVSDENAGIIDNSQYSPQPKYLQHLEFRVTKSTNMREFLTIIGGCANLKTLTLVISHYPDFGGWPKGYPPDLELASGLTIYLVEAEENRLRPRVMDKLFITLERALNKHCEQIRVQRLANIV